VVALQTQPVIDGIENMQIRYCTRTSIPDNFSCVATNPNWNRVESVKISLLMRSADNNLVNAPQPYQFDTNGDGVDETITPTDRRLRRVFTTTITLRNLVASD
jgi:type IV pilus assembly protein PilW